MTVTGASDDIRTNFVCSLVGLYHWQYPPVSQCGLVANGARQNPIGQQRDPPPRPRTDDRAPRRGVRGNDSVIGTPIREIEAHKSVGMVCIADIFPLEVLSGFIVMFCRIGRSRRRKAIRASTCWSTRF